VQEGSKLSWHSDRLPGWRAKGGASHGVGLFVLTLSGGEICAMTRFENAVLPWFGLPRSLPGR
jgi:hypothetical protein